MTWLPGQKRHDLKQLIESQTITEIRDAPDALLNERQLRVKQVTLSGEIFFDQAGAAAALAEHSLPALFMDFETIQFAVPIWAGTRPYQQIPFQFSVHRLTEDGLLQQNGFLDLSGGDPSRSFAENLIVACAGSGPIFVYNAGFEKARVRELAQRYTELSAPLLALNDRVIDLLPIARDHYYHPSQQGSWSIKAVLPALCPHLRYEDLEGVQDGGMAMTACLEALAPETPAARRAEIELQLLAYCALDTYALVHLWRAFTASTLTV